MGDELTKPTDQFSSWTLHQWAVVYAAYGQTFRGLEHAEELQKVYQREKGVPEVHRRIQSIGGRTGRYPADYQAAAKLFQAVREYMAEKQSWQRAGGPAIIKPPGHV